MKKMKKMIDHIDGMPFSAVMYIMSVAFFLLTAMFDMILNVKAAQAGVAYIPMLSTIEVMVFFLALSVSYRYIFESIEGRSLMLMWRAKGVLNEMEDDILNEEEGEGEFVPNSSQVDSEDETPLKANDEKNSDKEIKEKKLEKKKRAKRVAIDFKKAKLTKEMIAYATKKGYSEDEIKEIFSEMKKEYGKRKNTYYNLDKIWRGYILSKKREEKGS